MVKWRKLKLTVISIHACMNRNACLHVIVVTGNQVACTMLTHCCSLVCPPSHIHFVAFRPQGTNCLVTAKCPKWVTTDALLSLYSCCLGLIYLWQSFHWVHSDCSCFWGVYRAAQDGWVTTLPPLNILSDWYLFFLSKCVVLSQCAGLKLRPRVCVCSTVLENTVAEKFINSFIHHVILLFPYFLVINSNIKFNVLVKHG